MEIVTLNLLNGLSFGMLLFLMAAGLSLVFGSMGILNLAHGSFYMLGGYLGLTVIRQWGSFGLGLVAAPLAMAILGMIIYRVLLMRLGHDHQAQVLLTFGLVFIIGDVVLTGWGGTPTVIATPEWASGALAIGPVFYPKYRVFVIAVGVAAAISLWLLLRRTRLGAVIRAGVDDEEMARGVGIDVARVFLIVFGLGTLLAGLAGVLGGPFIGLAPGRDLEVLLFSFVVVVVGGLGSIKGAFIGAVFVGILDSVGKLLLPEFALAMVFAPMVIVLAVRPQGLFGRSGL